MFRGCVLCEVRAEGKVIKLKQMNFSRKTNIVVELVLCLASEIACFGSFLQRFARVKVKVKCTTVQALRLCTGRMAHRGSRGIALLYRHRGSVQAVRPIGGVEV
jgi:hypothetical protein